MTIEKMSKEDDDGRAKRLVTCDHKGCQRTLDFLSHSFPEMLRGMKKAGWRITKVAGSYHHFCERH